MDKYISLSDIAGRLSEMAPGYAIQSWLRDYSTLEFQCFGRANTTQKIMFSKSLQNGSGLMNIVAVSRL